MREGDGDEHLTRLAGAVAEIERLRSIGVPVDFVVHTGDLADAADEPGADPAPTRAGLAALGELGVSWYALGGNHDRRAHLVGADAPPGAIVSAVYPGGAGAHAAHADDLPALLAAGVCRRVHGPLDCLFVNANPEDGERDLHGAIAPVQVGAVADHLDGLAPGRRAAAFLHYPPLEQGTAWTGAPAGGETLHAALAVRAARLAGVFAGHVHRGTCHARDGLLYVSVPALSRGFALWPGLGHAVDDLPTAGYHYVSIGPAGTRVQSHAFVAGRSRPSESIGAPPT